MHSPVVHDAIIYRPMEAGEEQQVCDFVVRVFTESVAPLYSPEGVQEFVTYAADPGRLRSRLLSNHLVLVAEIRGRIVGVLEMRNSDHISLFFTDGEAQRQGIGRKLWQLALDACLESQPSVARITVRSSPNAVGAYEKLGFRAEGAEQTVNGIRFVPMAFAGTSTPRQSGI
jgi:GNAT superfamily N-acetyltransferase